VAGLVVGGAAVVEDDDIARLLDQRDDAIGIQRLGALDVGRGFVARAGTVSARAAPKSMNRNLRMALSIIGGQGWKAVPQNRSGPTGASQKFL
jgi:hypothetical protein